MYCDGTPFFACAAPDFEANLVELDSDCSTSTDPSNICRNTPFLTGSNELNPLFTGVDNPHRMDHDTEIPVKCSNLRF
jgi:hypothetical protein